MISRNYSGASMPAIAAHSACALGPVLSAIRAGSPASTAWPLANLAIFVPFVVERITTVARFGWITGAAPAGNVDCGVYSESGARLVSIGSTAIGAAGVLVTAAPGASIVIGPGVYFLGIACSGVGATFSAQAVTNASVGRAAGMLEMAAAFPLPANAVFAAYGRTIVPPVAFSQSAVL